MLHTSTIQISFSVYSICLIQKDQTAFLLQTSFLDLQGYCIFRCYDGIAKGGGKLGTHMRRMAIRNTLCQREQDIRWTSGSRISCFSAHHLLRSRVPVSHLSA